VLAALRDTPSDLSSSGGFCPDDQVYVTVEHLQQGERLIDRLAVVRLIKQSIQLRRRRPEPANDFALRQRTFRDSLLCFECQSVQQEIIVPPLPMPRPSCSFSHVFIPVTVFEMLPGFG
jgi:hypothetical protein